MIAIEDSALDSWIASKSDANRQAVLLGLFDKQDNIKQVIAFTVRSATGERAEQRASAMMGVVIEEKNDTLIYSAVVAGWLRSFVL